MLLQHFRSADELEQAARLSYVPVVAEPRPFFRGRMGLHLLGADLSLSMAQMTPLHTFATARMTARLDRDDLLMLCIHLKGSGWLHQQDRTVELSPGGGVVYEARSAWNLNVATNVNAILLHFPRTALPLKEAGVTSGLARHLDAGSPGMRLLSGYARELFTMSDSLSEVQRLDAGRAGLEMVTMALRGRLPSVGADSSAGEVLLGLMRSHIRAHLADSRLTVAELARRHHTSIRHAHDLFARIGTTPAGYIRSQRLLAARAMLSDGHYDSRTVAEIAADVGFAELRTFERAFKRQFATTPAAWRRDRAETS